MIVLDFDLQSETSLNFVERYSQLFLLDEGLFLYVKERNNLEQSEETLMQSNFSREVCAMAKYLCRYCLR